MMQRKTIQKAQIYAALTGLSNHPTADQVYDYVHETAPNISRATVNRVLHQMSENGQIRHVSVLNGADCYDHNLMPHSHAVCNCCRRVFDVPYVKQPLETFSLSECGGFLVTDYTLMFSGLCSDCQDQQKENNRNGQ